MRQTNFSAGELDPLLQGRTDLPLYGQGLATCRNFIITKSGAAMSRPGTSFVAEAKVLAAADYTGGVIPTRPVRLVPFVAGDGASVVLEFGEQYVRFHTLGRTVESPPGTAYELGLVDGAVYYAKDLAKLRFAQVGDVLTIVAPGYTAKQLRRHGPAAWEFSDLELSPPVAMFADTDTGVVTSGPAIVSSSIVAPDADHPELEWHYLVTAVYIDPETGATRETLGQQVLYTWDGADWDTSHALISANADADVAAFKFVIYPDKPLTLSRALPASPQPGLDVKVLRFLYYRGRGGVYGYVGETDGRDFIDIGSEPDYSVQPPLGVNPFRVAYAGVEGVEQPWSVAFFQDRLVMGGSSIEGSATQRRPNALFTSKTGDYSNFDTRLAIHVSGEALQFYLAATKREDIQHLVPRDRLVVLTTATAWTFGGSPPAPLDFDSVDARITDDVGATDVTPLVVDGAVLFIRAKGSGARALIPQASDTPYQGSDISIIAKHLFTGKNRTVVDWAYAEDPWSIVWAVRADGKLLSLTFDREHGQKAWARHETAGLYEAVCSVPEGEEDAVYVVVTRTIAGETRRYIERMTSRVRRVLETDDPPTFTTTPGITDTDSLYPTDVCLDCAFTYADVPTDTITSENLAHLIGKEVYVVARGSPVIGPLEVTDDGSGNGTITLGLDELPATNAADDAAAPIWVAHVGLAYTCDLETLSVRGPPTLQQKTIRNVGVELDQTRGVQTGQDFDHLDDWQQRDVADAYNALVAQTTVLEVFAENAWDKNARACVRQSLPLPVTVVGITRGVVGSDD